MRIIAFVPARGGSKSIPQKNIKSFCGKPLIYWNLYSLSKVDSIDEVIVATDCDFIDETVRKLSLPKVKVYRRKAENATDQSSTESVMLEYLQGTTQISENDLFILSQLTNPFTRPQDYEKGIEYIVSGQKDSVLSVCSNKRFYWTIEGKAVNYDFESRPRRQDFHGWYVENGAFYINSISNILKYKNRLSKSIGVVEMPEYTQVELDELSDWIICERLFEFYHKPEIRSAKKTFVEDIKIVISDVDGVLTDAGMYYGEKGEELKKFNTRDGMGFELLRNAGYRTGIITSESTNIVARRAKKLKVDYLYQGKKEGGKLESIREICKQENVSLEEVAYIGDDINCINALREVGLAACPANASKMIKELENVMLLENKGGEGCFREFAEIIIDGRSSAKIRTV